jgi:hypothetical protein
MSIINIRCASNQCQEKAKGHCRVNVMVPRSLGPKLGDQPTGDAKMRLWALLPQSCTKSNYQDCTLEVAWNPELDAVAQTINVILHTEFPIRDAMAWTTALLRPLEPVPDQIRAIFVGARQEHELDRFIRLRDALWNQEPSHSLLAA